MWSLETLGRVQLSRTFFMRDFLYSEIGNFHQIQNIPNNPDLAIERGRPLCETLLEPMQDTFGRLAVRSGYRSADLNGFGNANKLNCAANDNPLECHIWDHPKFSVAGASIVVPWFAERYAKGRDWRDLAWWIHDHLPYSDLWFFPKLCAFNIAWRPALARTISSYIAPKGKLLAAGAEPGETLQQRQERYADFPPFKGIQTP
ncbi:hypothetical protein [Algirhabdus cladophorae]|uniref:hypothetical protein n=1 Tax=Algirhabdus cladophorae TaxID=3377108 RepID=UPI003B84880B